jgi:hypothetical protein
MGRARTRPRHPNGHKHEWFSRDRFEGTLVDPLEEIADDPVAPEQMIARAEELGGVRGLALAVLCQTAFDRYRYRRHRKGRPLPPWMRRDGWTASIGRDAERWFEHAGDESQPFTLAWVRAQLPARGAPTNPRRLQRALKLFHGLFAGGPGLGSAGATEIGEG